MSPSVITSEREFLSANDSKTTVWDKPAWFAVYTRSRHEKRLAEELEKRNVESYLPLRQFERQWSDRRKKVEEPLFKGYLFVKVALKDRLKVLSSFGSVGFVGPNKLQPSLILDRDMESLRRVVEQSVRVDPFPYLKAGEKVSVRSGPFKGLEGFIVRKGTHSRLVLSIHTITQSISVEMDEIDVEPI